MTGRSRLILILLAVVVVVVAVVVISSGGSSTTSASGPATIEVKNGVPVGGVKKLTYSKGDTVDLTIKSDTADEVHVHGYDFHKDVAKGGTVHFAFKADIDGEFEVELEEHKEQLAALKVEP
jgi:hypothetical protein